MSEIGAMPVSFRGDGPWRGMTTQSRALPQHFELLENCYVSSDGSEIRPIPGFRTYVDCTAPRVLTTLGGGTTGFGRDVIDARRKVSVSNGAGYNFNDTAAPAQTMNVYADVAHIHGFDFVARRLVMFGESKFRIEPIRNEAKTAYVTITAVTFVNVNVTTLTLSANYLESDTGAGSIDFFNSMDDAGGGFPRTIGPKRAHLRLFIRGLTPGAAGTALNDKAHQVDNVAAQGFPAANQVNILTGLSGAGDNLVGQTAEVGWVTRDYTTSTNSPSDDEESLTIWTVPPTATIGPIISTVYPAYVANRQRDFGDDLTVVLEGGDDGGSRRRQLPVPYRLVPANAGERLLIAAPGYNCVFQAPVTIPLNYEATATDGVTWIANDIYDKPRCVGIPKAVMFEDTVKTAASVNLWTTAVGPPNTIASHGFGGPTNPARAGRYKFAVSYKDEVLGEEGLISEPITINTDNANERGVRLIVLFPGYVMHECLALSINIYRSQKNGEALFFDRTIPMDAWYDTASSPIGALSAKYGIQPNTALDTYRQLVEIRVPYTADETLKKHQGALPVIQQMPMGCKAVRTLRGGWNVYGGALGNNGKNLELWKSSLSLYYDSAAGHPNSDEVFSRIASNVTANHGLSGHEKWGCGVSAIPPAYMGQQVFSRFLFPYPRESVLLNKIVNNQAASTGGAQQFLDAQRDLRIQIDKSPLFEETTVSINPTPAFLRLPQAQIQISEPDHPDVVPATNTTIISHESGEDVEGIGEANGQMVICTRGKTYTVGYGVTPVGAPPDLATGRFGCIGANTMSSFDFGCAWMSDMGPAGIVGGTFQWIGETIQHFFAGVGARYKRDSTGMMRHAWTAHDPGRALLYFGLFADRAGGTGDVFILDYRGNSQIWDPTFFSDEARSRWPCDEILVYSYKVGSWSVWRPPVKLLVKWMAYGIDQQTGQPAMFFLGSDNRVYKMDDDFSQWNQEAIVCQVMTGTTGTVIATNGTFGTDITARSNGTYWNAGMEVLVVGQGDGRPLIKRTTLASISGSNVTLADSVTVASGDELHIGVRSYTVTTNYLSTKMCETARTGKLGVRYSVSGTSGKLAYVQGSTTTTQQRDQEPSAVTDLFTSQDIGFEDFSLLGASDGTGRVIDQALSNGGLQGTNARVSLLVTGGATVRMQDLYAEEQ